MDQLKVNMLAREYSDSIQTRFKKDRAKRDLFKKPIIISHHMLMGLKAGQEKVSSLVGELLFNCMARNWRRVRKGG